MCCLFCQVFSALLLSRGANQRQRLGFESIAGYLGVLGKRPAEHKLVPNRLTLIFARPGELCGTNRQATDWFWSIDITYSFRKKMRWFSLSKMWGKQFRAWFPVAFCHVRDENSAELHHAPVEFNSCLVSLKKWRLEAGCINTTSFAWCCNGTLWNTCMRVTFPLSVIFAIILIVNWEDGPAKDSMQWTCTPLPIGSLHVYPLPSTQLLLMPPSLTTHLF